MCTCSFVLVRARLDVCVRLRLNPSNMEKKNKTCRRAVSPSRHLIYLRAGLFRVSVVLQGELLRGHVDSFICCGRMDVMMMMMMSIHQTSSAPPAASASSQQVLTEPPHKGARFKGASLLRSPPPRTDVPPPPAAVRCFTFCCFLYFTVNEALGDVCSAIGGRLSPSIGHMVQKHSSGRKSE